MEENRRAATHKEEAIRIPLPSYTYGAVRRQRFAFGRITSAQAKANTMLQRRPEETEENNFTLTEQEEEEENTFLAQEPPSMSDCA